MDPANQSRAHRMALYATGAHACPYLEGRTARTAFVDPDSHMSAELYANLLRQGFRRSGPYVYRPACPSCSACQSLRIPVAEFEGSRRHRRNWRHNADLRVVPRDAGFDPEHFQLYRDYIAWRHSGGSMDDPTPHGYRHFLLAPWCPTTFYEFRLGEELLAVAVTDVLPDALSAVYTFFRPDMAKRGLGTYAIQWQMKRARELGMTHLYLGYWIADCAKMRYKADFVPHEVRVGNHWLRVT